MQTPPFLKYDRLESAAGSMACQQANFCVFFNKKNCFVYQQWHVRFSSTCAASSIITTSNSNLGNSSIRLLYAEAKFNRFVELSVEHTTSASFIIEYLTWSFGAVPVSCLDWRVSTWYSRAFSLTQFAMLPIRTACQGSSDRTASRLIDKRRFEKREEEVSKSKNMLTLQIESLPDVFTNPMPRVTSRRKISSTAALDWALTRILILSDDACWVSSFRLFWEVSSFIPCS